MMIRPRYGETLVPHDELEELLPYARELLEQPITKAAVYDLEQTVQQDVAGALVIAVLEDNLQLDEILTDFFLRELHRRLYGDFWKWAGIFRQRELNIGVAPEQIAMELRGALDTIHYRWENTRDWSAHELGIVTHAEGVRIHPFADGNGRTTRLHADLVFVAAQKTEHPKLYDWHFDKRPYIDLLQAYDSHRNPRELAAYIGTRSLAK